MCKYACVCKRGLMYHIYIKFAQLQACIPVALHIFGCGTPSSGTHDKEFVCWLVGVLCGCRACWFIDCLVGVGIVCYICDARVTPIIVWNCRRERPTGPALHLSGAGEPRRLETRMRTGQAAVRFPVACACFVVRFDVCLFRRGLGAKRARLNRHHKPAGGPVMS